MIDLVVSINKYVCGEESEIRSTKYFRVIEKAIIKCIKSNSNGDEYVKKCLRCAALVNLYQSFYDGNHRTALILFGILLEKKGFSFDFASALNDMKNKKLNITTIYDQSDIIYDNYIDVYRRYITYPYSKNNIS